MALSLMEETIYKRTGQASSLIKLIIKNCRTHLLSPYYWHIIEFIIFTFSPDQGILKVQHGRVQLYVISDNTSS